MNDEVTMADAMQWCHMEVTKAKQSHALEIQTLKAERDELLECLEWMTLGAEGHPMIATEFNAQITKARALIERLKK